MHSESDTDNMLIPSGDVSVIPQQNPIPPEPAEFGGYTGPEPTRFGDWEKQGRCIDF